MTDEKQMFVNKEDLYYYQIAKISIKLKGEIISPIKISNILIILPRKQNYLK